MPDRYQTLAELAGQAVQEQNARVRSYPTSLGTTRAVAILSRESCGVVVMPLRAGEHFAWHQHRYEAETLIVFEGEAEATIENRTPVRLIPGIPYLIEPGLSHSITAVTDTQLLAIAVPRAEGYPDAPTVTE